MTTKPNITMCMWKTIAMLFTAAALATGMMAPSLLHAVPPKAQELPVQLRPGERDILLVLARKIMDHSDRKDQRTDNQQLNRTISSLNRIMSSTTYAYHDIIYLQRYGVNLSELTNKMSSYGHYREAAFAYHLGRKDGKIDWDANNDKPKALVIAGEDDPNEAFAPTPDYVAFFAQVQSHYNLRYRVVKNPLEFCQEIAKAAKEGNIELLIVAGHGSPQTIRLGSDSRILANIELPDSKVLELLAPNAVIFLEACETGAGKEYNNNIANYFANHAPGRVVIAPLTPVTIQMEKASYMPNFDGKFENENGQDLTYRIDPAHPEQYCSTGSNGLAFCKAPIRK